MCSLVRMRFSSVLTRRFVTSSFDSIWDRTSAVRLGRDSADLCNSIMAHSISPIKTSSASLRIHHQNSNLLGIRVLRERLRRPLLLLIHNLRCQSPAGLQYPVSTPLVSIARRLQLQRVLLRLPASGRSAAVEVRRPFGGAASCCHAVSS